MARKVYVTSDISNDPQLDEIAETNPLAALLWPWLLTAFDDWGRAEASARKLKRKIWPGNDLVTTEVVEEALRLFNGHLITMYEVDGRRYMFVEPEKWFHYQTQIRKEKRLKDNSQFPPPYSIGAEDDDVEQSREEARDSAHLHVGARDSATTRANLADCIPSPSPSPSLSPSPSKESGSGGGHAHSVKNAFGVYEREIGELTYSVSQKLVLLEEDYSEEWLKRAIENAVFSGVKTLKYIEGTLRKWKATNHAEPWTLARPETQMQASGNPYPARPRYSSGGRADKPKLPVAKAAGSSVAPTPEELQEIRLLAHRLEQDKPERERVRAPDD